MTSEQIMTAYELGTRCSSCLLRKACSFDNCIGDITKYLKQEVETIERWKRIKCNADLVTIYSDYINKVENPSVYSFVQFLLERIPDLEKEGI